MPAWSSSRDGPLDDDQIDSLVAFLRGWQTVPSVDVDGTPVVGDPQRGQTLFAERCASCHGEGGRGGSGPSLSSPEFLATASDGFIRDAIANGRRGTDMPSFANELTGDEIDDLVALVRGWADP
jgi:mono/diheme cytochrome c family protein